MTKNQIKIGKEGYIALLAFASIAIYLVLQYLVPKFAPYSIYPLYLTLAIGGTVLILELIQNLLKMGIDASILPHGAGLECVILIDHHLAAHYRFRDSPRSDSKTFIHHLFPKHGIKKIMIISGDREEEVNYLAEHVGIKEVYAGKSPEEKVDLVIKETEKQKQLILAMALTMLQLCLQQPLELHLVETAISQLKLQVQLLWIAA